MSVMTESRNVSWRPIGEVKLNRKPGQCSFPGCTHVPTHVRTTLLPKTRNFVYCGGHLYV